MKTQEIKIRVAPEAANVYQSSSEDKKRKLDALLSAWLSRAGKPGRGLDYAQENGTVLLSRETAQELDEVLERDKFDEYVKRETRRELLLALLEEAEFIEIEEQIRECRDPDDDKFLALAVEGRTRICWCSSRFEASPL